MIVELRGRGKKWKVFYPDESGIATPFDVFDKDGVQTGTILAGAPSSGMVEAYFTGTREEAEEFARYLGATEVKVRQTATRNESLAKARKARAAAS